MARARTPAKTKPTPKAKPAPKPKAKPTTKAKPAARAKAKPAPKPAPKAAPKSAMAAKARRKPKQRPAETTAAAEDLESGAGATDGGAETVANATMDLETQEAAPASTGCGATTLGSGACGLPILTSVGGVDVSAQQLCQGHYVMRHGQLALVPPLVSAP